MHPLKSVLLLVALTVAGCASYKPVPDGYTGPTASIMDSGIREDGTKAQVFAVTEVDGNMVDNSFNASAQASQGHGASLTTRIISRRVPARPMKLKLQASVVTGAPIQAMALQLVGRLYSAEGVVDFTPNPDGRYVVRGELKAEGSSVWLEDDAGQVVTPKVGMK